jgi:cyclopropane fatty-acyl-phospholipid synthase-like methyltransferase
MSVRSGRFVRKFHLLGAVKAMNRLLRRVDAAGHKLQFDAEWRVSPPPEWFDHLTDQHWKWKFTRNSLSWERGIMGMLAMKPGCRVLDLCCGGGFFAYHFFSSRAASVVSVDFDPSAIAHAKRNFDAPNVDYRCCDIRTDLPAGEFDNVVWDSAIEHFTEQEILAILANIKQRLTPSGTLNGYTLVEKPTGKSLVHHEYEFKSKEELAILLKKVFKNAMVVETSSHDVIEDRQNLYFFASDGVLPFDPAWENAVRL